MNNYLRSFILLGVFLTMCRTAERSTDLSATAVSSPTPTITQTVTAVPTPTPITETPFIPDPRPTQTPRPTPTKYLTPTPPPLDVAELVQQLAFETVDGVNGRTISQLHVSEYGLRHQYSCEYGPYRWLDNEHLLLFPVTGYTNWFENPTGGEVTQPIVVSQDGAATWVTDISPTDRCDLPVWSAALRRLIEASGGQIRLRDLQGSVTNRYDGQMPLFLAPSGRRLLAGLAWIDLDTGENIPLGNYGRVKFPQPAWTADEKRFFECCFGYGDILTGKYRSRDSYPGFWVGGIGVGPGFTGTQAHWVANDTRVLVEPNAIFFRRDNERSVVPLIDPVTQTYEDVTERLGLPDAIYDCYPAVAPNGNHFWLGCAEWANGEYDYYFQSSYLVTLPSFETITTTGSIEFRGWSADSRFLAYAELTDPETYTGTTWLMDTSSHRQQIADEAAQLADWHGVDSLVALRFADKQRVQFVQAETGTSRVVVLDAPVTGVVWQPEDGGVALWDENGRIWWLPDPLNPAAEPEPLTPPLPGIHSVRWSPDGHQLAFVSETNLYIVSLDSD
jgi:hypothetical protein